MRVAATEVPTVPAKPAPSPQTRSRLAFLRGRGWRFWVFFAVGVPLVAGSAIVSYYYVTFSRMIDARMKGEFERTDPRIFARPLTIHRGDRLTEPQTIDRLNDLGYAQRARVEQPGEFAIGRDALAVIPRSGDRPGQTIRFVFGPTNKAGVAGPLRSIEVFPRKQSIESIAMDAP